MLRITATDYDVNDHEIVRVQFNSGDIVGINQAISMAEQGLISGVQVGRARNGRKTLRSIPDGNEDNNLINLPRI